MKTIPSCSSLALAEIDLRTGEAHFVKRAVEDGHKLNAGFANTKENVNVAKRWLAGNRSSLKAWHEIGVSSSLTAWELLPYSPRALAEWTGKMAKRVLVKPDNR